MHVATQRSSTCQEGSCALGATTRLSQPLLLPREAIHSQLLAQAGQSMLLRWLYMSEMLYAGRWDSSSMWLSLRSCCDLRSCWCRQQPACMHAC